MKKTLLTLCVLVATSTVGISAYASQEVVEQLARSKGCMACHAVDRRMVGPSFKSIAERYANNSAAEANLIRATMRGSSGTWGPIPMPASRNLSEAEATQLVQWILGKSK